MHKKKSPIYFVLLWIFLTSSFLIFSSAILVKANGYVMNWNTFEIERTALIMLDGLPRDVKLTFNNKPAEISLPYRIDQLTPGIYEVIIEKENYQPWSKTFILEAGQAKKSDKVYLYLQKPIINKLPENSTYTNRITGDFEKQANDLNIKENEIWYKDELITRFREKILSAILTDDNEHIIYQIGQDLRIMDLDGSNTHILVNLKSLEPIKYSDYGIRLIFTDTDGLYEAIIR